MKTRILFKDGWYYIQRYSYTMPVCAYDSGDWQWYFIRKWYGPKLRFLVRQDAFDYAKSIELGVEGYEIEGSL